jgi:hypothetical protein
VCAFGALTAGARLSYALPDCSTLPGPVVYLQVGDTQEPLVKALGRKLRDSQAKPMTLVYVTNGSCTNIDAIFNGTNVATTMNYAPSTAENGAWKTGDPPLQCTPPAGGAPLDVANSNVFISTCTQAQLPMGVGAITGPIQAYVFSVPKASTQTAINADEAYFVFGFGATGGAMPWIDPNFFFIRPPTKSTILTLAAAIGVPAAKWAGMPLDKSSQVLAGLTGSMTPEATIGILGVEIYDAHRDVLSALAFRAYQQKYSYYPDKTATSLDKQNVRDGHYLPWSPTIYLTHVDNNGDPVKAEVAYLFDLLQNKTPAPTPDFQPIDVIIGRGLVPDCAMKVNRMFEGGDLSLYTPKEPCGCYFESKTGMANASCNTCMSDATCGGGKCRYGYCEAK